MMDIIVPLIFSVLLVIGGVYTVFAANRYFKFVKTKGTSNVFSPLAIWFGYFIGVMLVGIGISIFCQAFR